MPANRSATLFVLICDRMTGSHFPEPSGFVHWLLPKEPQLVTVVEICMADFDDGVAAEINVHPNSARHSDNPILFIHLSWDNRFRAAVCVTVGGGENGRTDATNSSVSR